MTPEFNIDLKAKDNDGSTAFHIACEKGHTETAQMLIHKSVEFKIDLNVQDSDGNTPYHLASIMKNSNLKLMIMKNARSFNIALGGCRYIPSCKWRGAGGYIQI